MNFGRFPDRPPHDIIEHAMTDTDLPIAPLLDSHIDHLFPTLTPAQIARIAAHGRVRPIRAGEVLVEAGDHVVPFFVVTAGPGRDRPAVRAPARRSIAVHTPGQFTGEANMISGRRALFRARAREAGEVIELDREHLLALVQTDAELSEILMRAFILRRVELIAHGLGDVVLIGSAHSRRHAAHQGVPDAQRPPLHLHRSRPRRRRAGAARSLPRRAWRTCRC